ncbi:hypothetical protein DPEC_G00284670 [Dallia pectoralis]|uniref:Uncharacterized protein n=1 Tax=Dallia pectoralis TaxID=75939 RepID=A0ACC2FJD6_DALPE|nr:hypothetical protein DPEC_G00284670 [Dallia pectoralis]
MSMSADSFGAGGSDAQQSLQSFWPRVMEEIRNLTVKDFRVQELPLARIKKIMKLDEDVKMISAEAPVLFAKAAQIFITELTLRAWIHTEDNKRRTLQRNDIAMAITKFDQFDFLIDIVPRDELKPPKRQEEVRQTVAPAEPVQYYFTLAQQPGQIQGQQQGQQATAQQTTTLQPGQIIITQPQQGQVLQGATMQQLQQVQVAQSQGTPITSAPVTMQVGDQQVQIVQASSQGQAQTVQSGGQTMQVMQQIITNTGEIQQIPVQLNTGQLQYIRLAQPVSGTQVVQGQIQTLGNTQQVQITQTDQGQQQFNQFTDGQQLYQIQQVTMPAGQDLSQPMFIQSTNQTADGQVTTQAVTPEAQLRWRQSVLIWGLRSGNNTNVSQGKSYWSLPYFPHHRPLPSFLTANIHDLVNTPQLSLTPPPPPEYTALSNTPEDRLAPDSTQQLGLVTTTGMWLLNGAAVQSHPGSTAVSGGPVSGGPVPAY